MKVFSSFDISTNAVTHNSNQKDISLCCNTHQSTGARKLR